MAPTTATILVMPSPKRCPRCVRSLPTSAFHRCVSHPDGLQSRCKECERRIRLSYAAGTPERIRFQAPPGQRRCAACHETKPLDAFRPSTRHAAGRGYYCLDCARAKVREMRRRHKTEDPAKERARWAADARRWRAQNPRLAKERNRAATTKWRKADPARKNASTRAWYAANLLHARAIKHKSEMNRRARKRAVFVEEIDPAIVFQRDGGMCGICRNVVSTEQPWHIDHVIPLSKGGPHAYTNVQLAHASCNIAKGARLQMRKAG